MRNILFVVILSVVASLSVLAQDPPRPDTSEALMKNALGGYLLYNTTDGERTNNAVGGGVLFIYSTKTPDFFPAFTKRINFTLVNDFSGANNSLEPVGGAEYKNTTEIRFPLDLVVPFLGENSQVFVSGSGTVRWQSGGIDSKTQGSLGAGVGFKLKEALGGSMFTHYIYVPKFNDANSIREHRFSIEYYRDMKNNPKYQFFTGTRGGLGSFDPYPTDPTKLNFYQVKFFIGVSRLY